MSDRVTRIVLRAFRAVPEELPIALSNGRSLLVLGENGTGKSSVADALEFFFTGRIEPLDREGRGIVYHVGTQDASTSVEVQMTGDLGGTATLREGVAEARTVASRETFILRGRALAEFIDKTKGEKWRSLFEILGLGHVDQLRLDLQQARNALQNEVTNALQNEVTNARTQHDATSRTLAEFCPDPTEEKLLAAIKQNAERAGVASPATLQEALRQDWTVPFGERAKVVERSAQIGLLAKTFEGAALLPQNTFVKAWNAVIDSIKGVDLSRLRLVEAARDFLADAAIIENCPLCGHDVDDRSLRERIAGILTDVAKWSQALENSSHRLRQFTDSVASCWQQRAALLAQARALGINLPALPPSPANQLRHDLERRSAVDLDTLTESDQGLSDWTAAAVKLTLEALPSVRPEDAALVKLLELVQLGKRWLTTSSAFRKADRAFGLAERLHEGYLQRQNAYFDKVLETISGRVAAIYMSASIQARVFRTLPSKRGETRESKWGLTSMVSGIGHLTPFSASHTSTRSASPCSWPWLRPSTSALVFSC